MIKQTLSFFLFTVRLTQFLRKKKVILPIKRVTVNFFPKYNTNFVFSFYSMQICAIFFFIFRFSDMA